MALPPYTKPHATAEDRVRHLRGKGLIVPRPAVAARKIEAIGYERLRIYFLSRRQLSVPGRPFVSGTSYREILRLYECDSRLRDVCFQAAGNFELLFRNSISENLSRAFGSHPYFDIRAFSSAESNLHAGKMFAEVYLKSKDRRAKHFRDNYGYPIMPPIWTMKEFLTFGASSRIFQFLSSSVRGAVALEFGVKKDPVFTNWVECLVDLRNICAHHDRLFNRGFQKHPATLAAGIPTANPKTLKAVLQCLDYMMDSRGVGVGVTDRVENILRKYPEINMSEAGY